MRTGIDFMKLKGKSFKNVKNFWQKEKIYNKAWITKNTLACVFLFCEFVFMSSSVVHQRRCCAIQNSARGCQGPYWAVSRSSHRIRQSFSLISRSSRRVEKGLACRICELYEEGVMAHAQVNQPDWSTFGQQKIKNLWENFKNLHRQDTYEIFDRVISEKREVIRDKFTNEPLNFTKA